MLLELEAWPFEYDLSGFIGGIMPWLCASDLSLDCDATLPFRVVDKLP